MVNPSESHRITYTPARAPDDDAVAATPSRHPWNGRVRTPSTARTRCRGPSCASGRRWRWAHQSTGTSARASGRAGSPSWRARRTGRIAGRSGAISPARRSANH